MPAASRCSSTGWTSRRAGSMKLSARRASRSGSQSTAAAACSSAAPRRASPPGTARPCCRVSAGFAFANFPAFAPDGTLFVSDSGAWARNNGRVVRTERGPEPFSGEPCHFTNGLAVSPDGAWLWVAESYVPNVGRVELGSGRYELVVRLDGTVPDGLAFTSEGGLLISCYRPDRIYHLAGDGSLEVVAQDPQGTLLAAPTKVCFAGAELDRVVAANLGRRHLTLLDLGLRGGPLHAPERWAMDATVAA
jgi:gluconolactonase